MPYNEDIFGSKQLSKRLLIAPAHIFQEGCLGSVPASLTRLPGTSVLKPPVPAMSEPCCSEAFTLFPSSHLRSALVVCMLHTCILAAARTKLPACTPAQNFHVCVSRNMQPRLGCSTPAASQSAWRMKAPHRFSLSLPQLAPGACTAARSEARRLTYSVAIAPPQCGCQKPDALSLRQGPIHT